MTSTATQTDDPQSGNTDVRTGDAKYAKAGPADTSGEIATSMSTAARDVVAASRTVDSISVRIVPLDSKDPDQSTSF